MSGEMVPRGTPPPTGDLFAPLTPLQGEVPEERGHSGTSLSSRAGSAVPRDGSRKFIRLLKDYLMHFKRNLGQPENNASNRNGRDCKSRSRPFLILAIFGFPLKYPFPRGIFCSALALRRETEIRQRMAICVNFVDFEC